MSNYIDSIQLSGTVYTIQGTGGGGNPTVELTQAEYDALVSAGTVSANTYYIITDAQEGDLTQYWTSAQTNSAINAAVSGKQDTLISGTNIKTINNESILGSGNIDVHGDWNENSSGSTSYIKNRPFYMEASSSSECVLACVPLSDEAWDNNYGCVNTYTIQTTRMFTEGEKLGLSHIYENQYECEHPQVSPQTIVNNGGVLTVGPYNHWTLTSNDGVNWTVSQNGGDFCIQPVIFWKPTTVTYHKLDSNFIDSDIARTSAVTAEISAAVSGKVDTSAITSSVTSASTDNEIPTAKAVFDAIPTGGTGGGKAISAGTNISVTTGETADTINCTLPLAVGSGSRSLKNVFFGDSVGEASFAMGRGSVTSKGDSSFAFGANVSIDGYGSFGAGVNVNTYNSYETVFGLLNKVSGLTEFACGQNCLSRVVDGSFAGYGNSGNTQFIVGNGKQNVAQHNAFEVRQNGDIYIVDTNDTSTSNYWEKPMIKLQDHLGGGGASYSAGTGIDITNNVISVSGVVATSAITSSVTSASTDSEIPTAKAVYDIVGNIETLLSQI